MQNAADQKMTLQQVEAYSAKWFLITLLGTAAIGFAVATIMHQLDVSTTAVGLVLVGTLAVSLVSAVISLIITDSHCR